ncbi:hypothetical protein P353_15860 [Comamonas testosteroni]|uniref:Uncharacterized protein n=1 Tax=Comamonas testosteroni TaxID=285 RepID=A0A096FE47_COMTE|nr:hypothetical protein P353_15860 [Comamonas testosteroni]
MDLVEPMAKSSIQLAFKSRVTGAQEQTNKAILPKTQMARGS